VANRRIGGKIDLSLRLHGEVLLEARGLNILPKQIVGLVGANGSGKTTFLRALKEDPAGPFSLECRVKPYSPEEIAFCPSKGGLFEELSVKEHFSLLGALLDLPREVFHKQQSFFLEYFGLGEHQHSLARELSLGWQKRLALSLSLFEAKGLILLDEPLNGLDHLGMIRLFALLEEIKTRGSAVIIALHQPGDFGQAFDTWWGIEKGELKVVPGPRDNLPRSQAESRQKAKGYA
jgi:ABC-2 type transport system ATP-binding protein